ncbi:MAG: hypothetical protein SGJ11_06835 [Phycisphaerae bacterium]|nr:hypothetical protein [Phycisphaerae bacterium]
MLELILICIIALGVALLGARQALRRRAMKDRLRGPLRSLVMLRDAPRGLTESVVRTAIMRALGEEPVITPRPFDAASIGFLARVADGTDLLLIDAHRRYGADPDDVDDRIPDPALRQAMRSHAAWCSVDLFGRCSDADTESTHMPRLARIMAALDDGAALAFIRIDLAALALPGERTRNAFAAGDARSPFTQ